MKQKFYPSMPVVCLKAKHDTKVTLTKNNGLPC